MNNNNDKKIKDIIWDLTRSVNLEYENYIDLERRSLTEEISQDIDELVAYIKLNY